MRNTEQSLVFPRHWITKVSHADFSFSLASTIFLRNLSELTPCFWDILMIQVKSLLSQYECHGLEGRPLSLCVFPSSSRSCKKSVLTFILLFTIWSRWHFIAATIQLYAFMYVAYFRFVKTALYLIRTFHNPFSLGTTLTFCTIFFVELNTYMTGNNQVC